MGGFYFPTRRPIPPSCLNCAARWRASLGPLWARSGHSFGRVADNGFGSPAHAKSWRDRYPNPELVFSCYVHVKFLPPRGRQKSGQPRCRQ
jgi:hypothetical protein